MVRATSKELDIVEKVLETLSYQPAQITIEARFIEMPTETAGELGLDLPPPDAASETWTRILTAAQTRTVLRKAEQLQAVTILSAPKITTLSGRQTQIQVSDVNNIAKSRAETLTPPGLQSNNRLTARPELASEVQPGQTLDVLPLVDADGCTIRLSALSQATELLRYDNTPDGVIQTRLKAAAKDREARLSLSIIRALILLTRRMQAVIDVYDGQTLVLGKPKVTFTFQQPDGEPVGFAFPEDTGKRLVVFITPTIIDPAGNPIHTPGKEPFPANKPPPQPAQ
jgi:type II secretory pathway component GspD/PulD (secretin)